jgi:hypothetical protein
MLPSDTSCSSRSFEPMPLCTKPTSTGAFGSDSRARFCAEPSDASTSSVMPFFARIALYFCAAFQYVLPGGPAEITSVDGGAGWISLTASHTAAAASSTVGPIDSARSRHDTATKRARMRRGGRGLAGFMEIDG